MSVNRMTELAEKASAEYRCRMAAERAALGPRSEMRANLEDALTLSEMEMLADLLDPIFEHRSRVSEEDLPHAHRLHEMLGFAIRRQRFHVGVAGEEKP